jgi:hypothetical protein
VLGSTKPGQHNTRLSTLTEHGIDFAEVESLVTVATSPHTSHIIIIVATLTRTSLASSLFDFVGLIHSSCFNVHRIKSKLSLHMKCCSFPVF